MSLHTRTLIGAIAVVIASLASAPIQAKERVLNLYSARHYQTDEALYSNFTKQTGIKINRLDGRAEELLERIRNEGANSPADVLITVDAANLSVADAWGIFAPVQSKVLEQRIPANLRTPTWFSFSTRARVIIYNRKLLKASDVPTYESLAQPKLKGLVCVRSGMHPYNLSLVASLVAHNGEAATEQWAKGVVANLAMPPRGGDTDHIKSVASGECGVAVANTYYLARILNSEKVEERNMVKRLGIVLPNQDSQGTHVNVSGAGVVKTSKNREAAIQFLEYLASDSAQRYLAEGNNEWPVVSTVEVESEGLDEIGKFKADKLPLEKLSQHLVAAQKLLDRAGWR
jgi:iron(III) transport system substrate-binding protein